MENFEPIYIDLETEDGETIPCQVLAEYTVDEKDYIALVPVDDDKQVDDDPEIFIYGCEYDDDNIQLIDLDDDEFEVAGEALDDILADEE